MVNEIRLVFVIDALRAGDQDLAAQRIHLIVIRTILYFCYQDSEVLWGHCIFNSGTIQLAYRKTLFKSVTVDDVDQLLTQLVTSIGTSKHVNSKQPGVPMVERERVPMIQTSWEHVLNSALTDFPWDDSFTNYIFILSANEPVISEDRRKLLPQSFMEHKINFVHVDLNWVWDIHKEQLTANTPPSCSLFSSVNSYITICSSTLASNNSYLWFQEALKFHLTCQIYIQPKIVPFTRVSQYKGDFDTKLVTSIQQRGCQIKCVVLDKPVRYYDYISHLDHTASYFIVAEEDEAGDTLSDNKDNKDNSIENKDLLTSQVIIHYENAETKSGIFTPLDYWIGILYELREIPNIPCDEMSIGSQCSDSTNTHQYTFHSLHDLGMGDVSSVLFEELNVHYNEVEEMAQHELEEATLLEQMAQHELEEATLLEQIAQHHQADKLGEKDPPPYSTTLVTEDSSQDSELALTLIEEALNGPVNRSHITSLLHKCGPDHLTTPAVLCGPDHLTTPAVLKEKYKLDEKGGDVMLVKEHKIQVVLHLLLFADNADSADNADNEEKALEKSVMDVIALLRSLSFITAPTAMFKFLQEEIVPQFCDDCTTLLRSVFEDGFLMEPPALLRGSEDSLNSSILSTQPPLYCEDTNDTSSNDMPPLSQSQPFCKRKSWSTLGQHSQSSQSSFSITIPKMKIVKDSRIKDHIVASQVYNNKNCNQGSVGKVPDTGSTDVKFSCKVTPTEIRQSSKRRKLSRKNSVLDTPLKKQVSNAINAQQNRARERIEKTPQKCLPVSPVIQVQESPVRTGKASSFFGLQRPTCSQGFGLQRPTCSQGFKTPTRPSTKITLDKTPSLFDSSTETSPGITPPGITPPGTPKSERRFVKKLSYSPMHNIFSGEESSSSSIGHLFTPPKRQRKPLGTDYIYMMSSPNRDKENEHFMPSVISIDTMGLDTMHHTMHQDTRYRPSINTLEPIFDISEDARMPIFPSSSPSTHTEPIIAIPTSQIGFLKMLQESPQCTHADIQTIDQSDDSESSLCSNSSQLQGILKSPYNRKRSSRKVSFSFTENMFSSDNESDTGRSRVLDLLDIVDHSIRSDMDQCSVVDNIFSHTDNAAHVEEDYKTKKRKRLVSEEEACFRGRGLFLRKRLVSEEEACFRGRDLFQRKRLVSEEEACFRGRGLFLRKRLVSEEEASFRGRGFFLRKRLVSEEEASFRGRERNMLMIIRHAYYL